MRRPTQWQTVALVAAGVLLLLVWLSYNPDRAARQGALAGIGWRYLQGVLLTMVVWAIFSLGLDLQYGTTGLLNFGHVLFLGVGAYSAAVLTWKFGAAWHTAGAGTAIGATFVILFVAVAMSILAALMLGLPTLRLRADYLAIVTIGAAEVLRIFWTNEGWLTNGPRGLSVRMPGADHITASDGAWRRGVEAFGSTGIHLDPYFTFVGTIALAVLVVVYLVLDRLALSPWGRVLRAIRENEDVAAALGKHTFAFKMQSLAVGGVVAGIAGIMWAWSVRFVTPTAFLPLFTFYAWIIVVVGGAGSRKGAIVGSVVLWGLFEAARQSTILQDIGIAQTSGPEQVALIGLLLILIMRFRPQGILGSREELRVGH